MLISAHYTISTKHIVIDGKRAEITDWIIDRVLMSERNDPLNLRDDLSL